MAVPKEMKHMMKTTTTNHSDGVKRWAIEVKFPFGTLDKANKQFYDDNEHVKTGAPHGPGSRQFAPMILHQY